MAPGCLFSDCNKVNMGSKKVSAYFKKKDLGLLCRKVLTKNHYSYICSSENKREFSIIIETPARSEGTRPANDSQSQGQVRTKVRGSSHSCVGMRDRLQVDQLSMPRVCASSIDSAMTVQRTNQCHSNCLSLCPLSAIDSQNPQIRKINFFFSRWVPLLTLGCFAFP